MSRLHLILAGTPDHHLQGRLRLVGCAEERWWYKSNKLGKDLKAAFDWRFVGGYHCVMR